MTTWGDVKKRMQSFDVKKVAVKSIFATRADLIEWQKDQLWSGKLRSGGFIRPPYTSVTKRIKRGKGQPTDRVTLKDKGDFHDGIFVDIDYEGWTLESLDYKSVMLQLKYTTGIFGLNKISLRGYKDEIEPVFIEMSRKELKL